MFTNEFYYDVEQQIDNYIKHSSQITNCSTLREILEIHVVQKILENSFDKVSREPRQVYHHVCNAIENKRYLYPVVTTYMIRKLPAEYFFKKIFGSQEFSLFDKLMKHFFELPVHKRVYKCALYTYDFDEVISELLQKIENYDVKIRESYFFHKDVLNCPLNQCINNWKFLHIFIKKYKFSFDNQWKKQYTRLLNEVIPSSFKKVAYIDNLIIESDEEDDSDMEVEDFVLDDRLIIRYNYKELTRFKLSSSEGSCLFEAISYYLYGNQDHHLQIRQDALNYMYQNPNEFIHVNHFFKYRHDECIITKWRDNKIMFAISKHYHVNIKIYFPSFEEFIDATMVPDFTENTVLLYYDDHNNKYDLLF